MSRLTRDETAEPVSRDQVLRREHRGQGNIHFPSCSIGNLTPLIDALLGICVAYIHARSQLSYFYAKSYPYKTHVCMYVLVLTIPFLSLTRMLSQM